MISVVPGTNVTVDNTDPQNPIVSASGGGGGGGATVLKFPFAYNTANILTGHTVYTPTVGDVLLDAWVEILTAWNGTTPKGDVGTFAGFDAPSGWFAVDGSGAIDMTGADTNNMDDLNSQVGSPTSLLSDSVNQGGTQGRQVPAKFIATNPIKVCVSQNGTNTGANPSPSQGSAVLYLMIATPV